MNVADVNSGLVSAAIRTRMVDRLRDLGIRDPRVLDAMATVPRHVFVDPALASRAYEDSALPIGHGQTISQPYIVARTAELAAEGLTDLSTAKVLEIGTGCGYAAAVLAQLFGHVYSIERLRPLHEAARTNLRPLWLANLRLVHGDGIRGIPGEAPFDVIVAAAATADLPAAWLEQLTPVGRIVAPLEAAPGAGQRMTVVTRDAAGRVQQRVVEPVRFVPLRPGVGR